MIKNYEGFFNNNKKKDIQIKLSQAFVDFFKDVNPDVVSYYNYDNFFYKSKNSIAINFDNLAILYINMTTRLFEESVFEIVLGFHQQNIIDLKLPDDVEEFITEILGNNIQSSEFKIYTISEKQIPEIISKLTLDNYELFRDTQKYNL